MQRLKVEMVHVAADQPTTGGQCKRMVKTIKSFLDEALAEDDKIEVPYATALACYSYK